MERENAGGVDYALAVAEAPNVGGALCPDSFAQMVGA